MVRSGCAEARQILQCRPDEHRAHEEGMVGARADDADLDAICRVPAGEAVKAVEPIARVEVIDRALAIDGERLAVARDIDRPPPHVSLRIRVSDHPLVLGRSARLHSGIGDQCSIVRNAGVLLVTNGVLVERTRREIAVYFGNRELVLFQVEVAHRILRLFTSQTTQGQCLWRHSKLFARKREDDSIHGA